MTNRLNFINNEDLMYDFSCMNKDEFLSIHPYIKEEAYDNTLYELNNYEQLLATAAIRKKNIISFIPDTEYFVTQLNGINLKYQLQLRLDGDMLHIINPVNDNIEACFDLKQSEMLDIRIKFKNKDGIYYNKYLDIDNGEYTERG